MLDFGIPHGICPSPEYGVCHLKPLSPTMRSFLYQDQAFKSAVHSGFDRKENWRKLTNFFEREPSDRYRSVVGQRRPQRRRLACNPKALHLG
jgi:hypothetical protein